MRHTLFSYATISVTLLGILAGCSPSTVSRYAGLLAADTGRLNDQIEQLTQSRRQIEAVRARLTTEMDLSTSTTQQYTRLRLATWAAFTDDPAFKRRLELFDSIKTYTDSAISEQATNEALTDKLKELTDKMKGQRSEQLTESAKYLAELSKEPSFQDSLKFLTGYGQNVHDSIEKAKKDASAAATNAATPKP
jgi:septal ring factor EnvC (AmiA/AmiB activator)